MHGHSPKITWCLMLFPPMKIAFTKLHHQSSGLHGKSRSRMGDENRGNPPGNHHILTYCDRCNSLVSPGFNGLIELCLQASSLAPGGGLQDGKRPGAAQLVACTISFWCRRSPGRSFLASCLLSANSIPLSCVTLPGIPTWASRSHQPKFLVCNLNGQWLNQTRI